MDPIVRALSNVRALRSACDPFDRESLSEYLCKMGEDFGFSPIRHPRNGLANILCAWKDANKTYLAADSCYGNEKEILGSILGISTFKPHIGMLITASKPFWGISDVLDTLRSVALNMEVLLLVDVKTGNVMTWRW